MSEGPLASEGITDTGLEEEARKQAHYDFIHQVLPDRATMTIGNAAKQHADDVVTNPEWGLTHEFALSGSDIYHLKAIITGAYMDEYCGLMLGTITAIDPVQS